MDYAPGALSPNTPSLPIPLHVSADDTDLYWRLALDMYAAIKKGNESGILSVFIVPVGPVYQYRRFVELVDRLPINLSKLHLFFMDEYILPDNHEIPEDHPLSFHGFINRELLQPMNNRHGFQRSQVYFPDPREPEAYDEMIAGLGGAAVCYAGVGINGHLAFNEAPCAPDSPSRIVNLNPETITTNSHTVLGGAYELIPRRAVTVGMKSILASRRLSIWMNRPWQKAAVRKLLFGAVGPEFPASYARNHPKADLNITHLVAEAPQFALR